VTFAGVISPGLYQLKMIVRPALADGDATHCQYVRSRLRY